MRPLLVRQIVGPVLAVFLATLASAQQPASRLFQEIDARSTAILPGSQNPHASERYDAGRLDPATSVNGVTIYFQPTAEQQAQLDALVQAQQISGSPYYHAWLAPAEYASRFGLSDSDLAKIQTWLESQGFNIERVSNSRTSIRP